MSLLITRWQQLQATERAGICRRAAPLSLPLALALLTFAGVLTNSAWTHDAPPVPKRDELAFHIPSQPLDAALQAFSQATGIEVLYESSIADGLYSTSLEGAFAPKLALAILLTNTDLKVHYTRSDAITISLPPAYEYDLPPMHPLTDADLALDTLRVTDGDPKPDPNGLRAFSESVQADIESALRKDARTKNGNYRVSIRLWVDPQRTVSRIELMQSTGDTDRDGSIAEILQGLVLKSGPPANTPQPVRVAIAVRSL